MPLEPRITTLENLGDVSATVPTNNQVMAYSTSAKKFGPVTPPTVGEVAPGTDGTSHVCVARATYDFAVDGGAVGDIALAASIPSGAIVLDGMVDVLTPLTGGAGATAAVKVEGAGDIIAAAVVTGVPWSTTGLKDVVPVGTAATAVLTTAARAVTLTVGVADLTAGKAVVLLRYVI